MTPDIDREVQAFAARARRWVGANMPTKDPGTGRFFLSSLHHNDADELARIERCRELQALLFKAGFAGICVPVEYGGQGLTPEHQAAFNRELQGYDYPAEIQSSTFVPCMAVLLEFGTEDQKQRHIPAMLRGDEIWVQLLSEPGGGSDAAGALTTAVRDGEQWIVNGSKIWTTGGWYGDWAMCLTRTNWDVEKHRGLTVFSFPMNSPGIAVTQIELLNGSKEFCQEFLTDVVVEDRDRIGSVDDGWTVISRWLFHERTISGGSPYMTGEGNRPAGGPTDPRVMLDMARERCIADHTRVRELIGEAQARSLVGQALVSSVTAKMQQGSLNQHAAAMLRLYSGLTNVRKVTIAFELAGEDGVAWPPERERTGQAATAYVIRQAGCIGSGTTEMARNVISERLLGMPRELRADVGAFRDVPRGPTAAERR